MKCAKERGVDAAPIAQACGLDPRDFSQVTRRISLPNFCRFLETLAALTGDPSFGLNAGAALEKGASGIMGYALMHAPTAGHAVELVKNSFRKFDSATIYHFHETDSASRIEWTYSPLIVRRSQFVDLAFVAAIAHFRTILGPGFQRVKAEIERERPENPSVYREHIARNLSFGAAANALIIPHDELDRVNPAADPRLFDILRAQMESLPNLEGYGTDPVQTVRQIVEHSLGQAQPSLAELADRTGMSERTLQRRLAEASTSLHEIIDDSRRDLAEQLLVETDLSLSQISERLGFSASSAFTRSASRWFGTSPSLFRRRRTAAGANPGPIE
ncbi:AraC family transcriptional regulator [Pseudohoeflea suaedae]|nr:AraC family transcriptional regulator [Pseudohoeflea suaedae]